MIIVLLPGTFIRFDSLCSRETLLDARRHAGGLIVYGHARRDRYDVGLRDEQAHLSGTLWTVTDRRSHSVPTRCFHTKVIIDCGVLPDDYDGAWVRNYA